MSQKFAENLSLALLIAKTGSAGILACKNTTDATNAGEDARSPNFGGDGVKKIPPNHSADLEAKV